MIIELQPLGQAKGKTAQGKEYFVPKVIKAGADARKSLG